MKPGPLLVLTDRRQADGELAEVVDAVVDGGARCVVLREKDLPERDRAELAHLLGPIVHRRGGLLLSAGTALPGCDGVHLPSPSSARASTQQLADGLVGRSCHDLDELVAAATEGADYATVSPVYATASKPGYGPPLGPDGLAALVEAAAMPVYALGGIETAAQVSACLAAGAEGVAVMGALMRAEDPASLTADLLRAAGGTP